MKSITEIRDELRDAIIKHGVHTSNRTPEIDNLIGNNADLLAWAEKARPWLNTAISAIHAKMDALPTKSDRGREVYSQYVREIMQLLAELPE